MKIFPKKFPQAALDALAKSVADEVFNLTKVRTGYGAREKPQFHRVEFTFAFGTKYSFPIVTVQALSEELDWQVIHDKLVDKVLTDVSPATLARRMYERTRQREFQPEVPVFVDQQGRRHFTLKAETGQLGALLGSITMRKGNEQTQPA